MRERKVFKNIGNLIKSKRLKAINVKGGPMSQSDLSEIIGYKNGQFVSNVERALCSIPAKMAKKVRAALDITADEMMDAYLKDCEESLREYVR